MRALLNSLMKRPIRYAYHTLAPKPELHKFSFEMFFKE